MDEQEAKKAEEQRNINNNANNVKNAANVAMASKIPPAMIAGAAVKAADKLTGGKSTQLIGKALNTANKMSPLGKRLQNMSNKASESGASDAAGKAAGLMGGGKGGNAANAANAASGGDNIPSALKNPNPNNENLTGNKKQDPNSPNKSQGGLDKKDGLPEKDGVDSKKKEKDKKKNDKKKKSDSSDGILSEANALAKKIKRFKIMLIIKGCLVLLCIAGAIFLASYLTFVWDTFMTSIISFFGLSEGPAIVDKYSDEDKEVDKGLWVEDKYFSDPKDPDKVYGMNDYETPEGEIIPGIATVLKNDDECKIESTFLYWFNNLAAVITGNFDGNVCRLLNYVWGTTNRFEEKYKNYGLNIDESIIISTIFYGYSEQPNYVSYEDPEEEYVLSGSEHYQSIANALGIDKNGEAILEKEDIDRIIDSTIFEEVWPYYRWKTVVKYHNNNWHTDDTDDYSIYKIKTKLSDFSFSSGMKKKDKVQEIVNKLTQEFAAIVGTFGVDIGTMENFADNPKLNQIANKILDGATDIPFKIPVIVGQCKMYDHLFFYYSKEKLELFIRFNDEKNLSDNLFGIPGYVGSKLKSGVFGYKNILDRSILNESGIFSYDMSTIYGSGWVYDTNMNNSFINTSEPCNGSMTKEEIIAQYGVDKIEEKTNNYEVTVAHAFFKDRGMSETVVNFPYFQKVQEEDLYTLEKDKMIPQTRKYTDTSVNEGGSYKTATITFEYKNGFAYERFPMFLRSKDVEGFEYDEITTPKKIEVVLIEIEDRKDDFDEVLDIDSEPTEVDDTEMLTVKRYCDITQEKATGSFEVVINDCEGKYMTTRSFKEYILGVTLGEIGYVASSSLDEYIKTQMIASISYTLGRENKYTTDENGNPMKRSNYENSRAFVMRSGSCDQNWCDIYLGCSRSEEGAFIKDDGKVLLATYPGAKPGAVTKKTCTVNGVVGKNYYMCPLTSAQTARYSKLFDDALQFVVASGTVGYEGDYNATTQAMWQAKAKGGYTAQEILEETYPSSEVNNCSEIAEKEERTNYEWPTIFSTTGNAYDPDDRLCISYNSNYDATWNNKIIEVAYRLAGSTIGDCSSFVRKVIRVAGAELGVGEIGRMSSSTYMFKDYGRCNCAETSDLKPGDIVFQRTNPSRWMQVGHIAIFAGYDEQGRQMIFESNSRVSAAATGSYDKPALVVDPRVEKIAGYSRWYPPQYGVEECKGM